MTSASVIVRKAKPLVRKLRRVESSVESIIDGDIQAFGKRSAKRLRKRRYPNRLQNQKYKRTYKLKKSFGYVKLGPAVTKVFNDRPGAYHVINEGTQAGVHDGRWWTLQEEVINDLPWLTGKVGETITDYVSD